MDNGNNYKNNTAKYKRKLYKSVVGGIVGKHRRTGVKDKHKLHYAGNPVVFVDFEERIVRSPKRVVKVFVLSAATEEFAHPDYINNSQHKDNNAGKTVENPLELR